MATVIGFYHGEGSNPAELSDPDSKELVVAHIEFGIPITEIVSTLATQFAKALSPTAEPEDYLDWMVIATVIGDDGQVYDTIDYTLSI